MKGLIKGVIGATVIVVGGVAYSFTQEDVARNMSIDTGMTEQQVEQWVEDTEDQNASWTEIGNDYVYIGEELLDLAYENNCSNFVFDWERPSLTCEEGLSQIITFANSSKALGKSYIRLDSDYATEADMMTTIKLIGQFNANLAFDVIEYALDQADIDDLRLTNTYNKAILTSALED